MHPVAMGALFALQCFHVLFLALHDWIPLGTFNDLKAVREANPGRKLVAATLISLTPFAIGLAASAVYFGRAYPAWLFWWLWISYGLLFVGELTAWWIPYLFHPEPERAARYQVMFGATHAFLPERNGIRPNTLHVILHIVTLTALVVLGALTAERAFAMALPPSVNHFADQYVREICNADCCELRTDAPPWGSMAVASHECLNERGRSCNTRSAGQAKIMHYFLTLQLGVFEMNHRIEIPPSLMPPEPPPPTGESANDPVAQRTFQYIKKTREQFIAALK